MEFVKIGRYVDIPLILSGHSNSFFVDEIWPLQDSLLSVLTTFISEDFPLTNVI